MKAAQNILLMIFLGLSLSFCSSASKDSSDDSLPSESDYSSSSTYDDITGAASGDDYGEVTDYGSDDSYGDTDDSSPVESSSDDLLLGGMDEGSGVAVDSNVQKIQEYEDAPEPAAPTDFKDGFYNIAVNCNMRAEPSAASANEGKIKAGKRLWVEGYNNDWVRVFKKSGPVYISKVCL
jgi:hypothetical protein